MFALQPPGDRQKPSKSTKSVMFHQYGIDLEGVMAASRAWGDTTAPLHWFCGAVTALWASGLPCPYPLPSIVNIWKSLPRSCIQIETDCTYGVEIFFKSFKTITQAQFVVFDHCSTLLTYGHTNGLSSVSFWSTNFSAKNNTLLWRYLKRASPAGLLGK